MQTPGDMPVSRGNTLLSSFVWWKIQTQSTHAYFWGSFALFYIPIFHVAPLYCKGCVLQSWIIHDLHTEAAYENPLKAGLGLGEIPLSSTCLHFVKAVLLVSAPVSSHSEVMFLWTRWCDSPVVRREILPPCIGFTAFCCSFTTDTWWLVQFRWSPTDRIVAWRTKNCVYMHNTVLMMISCIDLMKCSDSRLHWKRECVTSCRHVLLDHLAALFS